MSSFETWILIALAAQVLATISVAVGIGEIKKEIGGIWRRLPPLPPRDYGD